MILPFVFSSLLFFSTFSIAIDSLFPNQTLKDDGNTLVSASESFELGFFSPPNTNNRYIAIWFKRVPQKTPIWVANKNDPVTDSSGAFTITALGNILITSNKTTVWTSNSSSLAAIDPVLKLLDNGNLIVQNGNGDDNTENFLWQSFDSPGNTLLPGMKLGWNLKTHQEWYLTSWKSHEDPSPGDYTYRLDPRGLGQIIFHSGSQLMFRSGPWVGDGFAGGPPWSQNSVFNPIFVFNSTFVYYTFENIDNSTISRFTVNSTGLIDHLTWDQMSGTWVNVLTFQIDSCDRYGLCGPYGACNINDSPICHCPKGFLPKEPQDWNRLGWSGGCVRNVALNCSASQGFIKLSGVKMPDSKRFVVNQSHTSDMDCRGSCLRNCSCTAYAENSFIGCVVWFGDLVDMRKYSERGQDVFIKMDALEIGSHENKRTVVIASLSVVTGAAIILGAIGLYLIKGRLNSQRKRAQIINHLRLDARGNNSSIKEEDLDLPLFDLATIAVATNEFSFSNKLGEGGFGPVYKGCLSNGQEIAVKRLSKNSGQGLEEFKNEVILISRLQHRNLVRILGCCIHKEERMLIYEYMPNKSLDLFIFNQTRGTSLDWQKRIDIILGIARGLLYLHRDSRLRIIHRDLKASNILLDSELNPKISDFGLARTFGGEQSEENTKRVLGTYGYMSPEYAIDGLFSVKSDVFSFGVLVLEIVSGRKNKGFCHSDHELNLLGHAWSLWSEGDLMGLVDPFMEGLVSETEILKCIHVALLCVQHRPDDRPAMSAVVVMLDSEDPLLPLPKQPGFYAERFHF